RTRADYKTLLADRGLLHPHALELLDQRLRVLPGRNVDDPHAILRASQGLDRRREAALPERVVVAQRGLLIGRRAHVHRESAAARHAPSRRAEFRFRGPRVELPLIDSGFGRSRAVLRRNVEIERLIERDGSVRPARDLHLAFDQAHEVAPVVRLAPDIGAPYAGGDGGDPDLHVASGFPPGEQIGGETGRPAPAAALAPARRLPPRPPAFAAGPPAAGRASPPGWPSLPPPRL